MQFAIFSKLTLRELMKAAPACQSFKVVRNGLRVKLIRLEAQWCAQTLDLPSSFNTGKSLAELLDQIKECLIALSLEREQYQSKGALLEGKNNHCFVTEAFIRALYPERLGKKMLNKNRNPLCRSLYALHQIDAICERNPSEIDKELKDAISELLVRKKIFSAERLLSLYPHYGNVSQADEVALLLRQNPKRREQYVIFAERNPLAKAALDHAGEWENPPSMLLREAYESEIFDDRMCAKCARVFALIPLIGGLALGILLLKHKNGIIYSAALVASGTLISIACLAASYISRKQQINREIVLQEGLFTLQNN